MTISMDKLYNLVGLVPTNPYRALNQELLIVTSVVLLLECSSAVAPIRLGRVDIALLVVFFWWGVAFLQYFVSTLIYLHKWDRTKGAGNHWVQWQYEPTEWHAIAERAWAQHQRALGSLILPSLLCAGVIGVLFWQNDHSWWGAWKGIWPILMLTWLRAFTRGPMPSARERTTGEVVIGWLGVSQGGPFRKGQIEMFAPLQGGITNAWFDQDTLRLHLETRRRFRFGHKRVIMSVTIPRHFTAAAHQFLTTVTRDARSVDHQDG